MVDGTIAGLRSSEVQTYWDAEKSMPGGKLRFDRHTQLWDLGV